MWEVNVPRTCSHCNTKNGLSRGVSSWGNSSLADDYSTVPTEGWSCYNCGNWIDGDHEVKPFVKPLSQMDTTRLYFDELVKMRAEGITWMELEEFTGVTWQNLQKCYSLILAERRLVQEEDIAPEPSQTLTFN